MKKLRLKETATQYTVTRNRYGDLVLSNPQTILCLYRDITQLSTGVNFREELNIVGIFWFDPSSNIHQGDVVGFNGQLYRIENRTNAKALLTSNAVQFIKCQVSLYRAIS